MTLDPNELQSDPSAAIEFLKVVQPDSWWTLTAIHPDRKRIETRGFRMQSAQDCLQWIQQRTGIYNLYWMPNNAIRELSRKANREDVAEMRCLYVDLDPRAGEDIAAERQRCLALLTTNRPAGVPEPSLIIDSGGGYQAFWFLTAALPIAGSLAVAEDAKRYNQRLEVLFGADNCHNIDRIMRLPFTLNIPDDRKRRKGRSTALATVVSLNGVRYSLDQFTPATAIQMPGSFSDAPKVEFSIGTVERLKDVNELDDYNVSERTKIIIVQGSIPDVANDDDKDYSRSGWLFRVVCHLVRNEVPDATIFSILTDPAFAISGSVLEKGSAASKYALRQIERAKDFVVDPVLQELNEKFAVIGNLGGKCRVVEEVIDPVLKRPRLVKQTFDDFQNRYRNRKIDIGDGKSRAAGHWWLDHGRRRYYDRIVFAPGMEIPDSYNLWQGFAYEPKPGSLHESFLEHLRTNVCQGNDEYFGYLINWMARAVQKPGEPGAVAIVMRGGKGVGKSFVAHHFGKLYGRHYLQVSNPSHLVGNFNSHLRDVIFLFADEAFYAGDKKHESILKTLITEDNIQIEAKGVDVETSPNFVHLMMASNEFHMVRASGDERRFFVLDVGSAKQQQRPYFQAIAADLANGGYENLLHHLLRLDLGTFDVGKVPQTSALLDQKESTLQGIDRLGFEMLVRAEIPVAVTWVGANRDRPFIATSAFQYWAQNVLKREVSDKKVGHVLHALGGQPTRKDHQRGWILPPLAEARTNWNTARFSVAWDDATKWHPAVYERLSSDTPF